jgi:drug/metabolite transporter (DMT)-like permease
MMSLESVISALFGVLILHETMMLREIRGCVLIFSGVLLVQLEPKKTPE